MANGPDKGSFLCKKYNFSILQIPAFEAFDQPANKHTKAMTTANLPKTASRSLVEGLITSCPDFPKPGVLFRDFSPLLADPEGLRVVNQLLSAHAVSLMGLTGSQTHGRRVLIAGVETRGFVFAAMLARHLNLGLLLIRKPGKTPNPISSDEYAKEYGTGDRLEVSSGAFSCFPASKTDVIIVDDLIAIGGTSKAAIQVVQKSGAKVLGVLAVAELSDESGKLIGREAIASDFPEVRVCTVLQLSDVCKAEIAPKESSQSLTTPIQREISQDKTCAAQLAKLAADCMTKFDYENAKSHYKFAADILEKAGDLG